MMSDQKTEKTVFESFRLFRLRFGDETRFQGGVVQSQIMLRGLVTLAGGADEPFHGFLLIFFHAAAGLITETEVALGRGQFLLGGGAIPFDGFFEILKDDLALLVENTQVELRRRI